MSRIPSRRHVPGARSVLAPALCGLAGAAVSASPQPQDFMNGATADAAAIADFGWVVLTVFCVATVVMWALLIWVVLRRRGSFEEHAHVATPGGRHWIVIGGLVIPGAVLLALFVMMFGVMGAASPHSGGANVADGAPEIRIVGQQWWFDAEYLGARPDLHVHAPTEVHIPVGRRISVELVTRDVIHSFWIPRLHGKVDLVPGSVNRASLRADRAGIYHGQCAEFCGVQHAQMRLVVVAEPETEYRKWLQRQRQPAVSRVRANAALERGQQVFMAAACPLCHTVRGTLAQGRVGPDLTHVGARQRIAGGALANDTANLAAWVTDAQSLKPGAHMPTLHQMSGQDLRSLVAYLQSLQ